MEENKFNLEEWIEKEWDGIKVLQNVWATVVSTGGRIPVSEETIGKEKFSGAIRKLASELQQNYDELLELGLFDNEQYYSKKIAELQASHAAEIERAKEEEIEEIIAEIEKRLEVIGDCPDLGNDEIYKKYENEIKWHQEIYNLGMYNGLEFLLTQLMKENNSFTFFTFPHPYSGDLEDSADNYS